METPLISFIYTHNIAGALDLLPRLYTYIKALQATLSGTVHLLDVGGSCLPDVWPCDVTAGRAVLIGLDAMGYTAANVAGVLTPPVRDKMAAQTMMALVDAAHPHQLDGLTFCVDAPPQGVQGRVVMLSPHNPTPSKPDDITFPALERGQIGIVQVYSSHVKTHAEVVPPNTLPDATIAGTVDFIRDEARYYSNRHNGHTMP